MASIITMPKLGLTMKTGTVTHWNAAVGDPVVEGEVVVEVMTEKITYQLESPATGVLLKVLVYEDEEVPVGTLIGVVGQSGEDVSTLLTRDFAAEAAASISGVAPAPADAAAGAGAPAAASPAGQPSPASRVAATPAARKLAAEVGVDITHLSGTGPGGRVTIEDVTRAAEDVYAAPARAAAPGPSAAPAEPERPVREVVPYHGVRRAIGERMVASHGTSPTVTHHVKADVHPLLELVASMNATRPEGERVSVTAAVVKAVALGIEKTPRINSSLHDDRIMVWSEVNVGVAVAVPDGLIVPVVRDVDRLGVVEISRRIKDLAGRAREDTLQPEEVSGGTFTVTSLSGFGSVDWFSPIINPPEAAILGVGRVVDDVVVVDGRVEVRPTMGLSLTFDHRIIDGAPAAEFLAALLDCLAHPERLAE